MNTIGSEKYPHLVFGTMENNANSAIIFGPYEKLHVNDWKQSNVNTTIFQAYNKMKIRLMKPIQKYSFLYLMNYYNTAMVGFSKGKSVSYLTSIFSLIMNNTYKVTQDIGPIAIVLTNSIGSCCKLEHLSKQLISFANTENKIKVVVANGSTPVHTVEAALCDGCNILITTPTYLNNLVKQSELFSWLNLKHFVFDNVDLLLENNKDEIIGLLEILKKVKDKTNNIQFISASVRWTKDVDDFLKNLFVKWQYVFGSSLEAAHYMKVRLNVVHGINDKLEKILECLKNNIKYGRSVLITSNPDELDTISSYFKSDDSNIEVLLANSLKSAIIYEYTIQIWKSALKKKQRLLICSDAMMLDYFISDADCLIHYDIPAKKHTFSIRFSVLQDSNSIFKEKIRSTYIFLSDSSEDNLQLPKIVDLMRKFGNGKIDPILLRKLETVNDTLERAKINSSFCSKIQQFGFCPNQSLCNYRHFLLKEIDTPADNIPKSGLAIIQILNVYDATHMSVKILKINHTNNLNDDWVNVDSSATISRELNSLYSDPIKKIIFKKPKPGDIVAVELHIKFEEFMYYRATVIDLVDLSFMSSQVRVKLIDEGYDISVSESKIFVLPEKYKYLQTNVVNMYVSSVKPVNSDTMWCTKADEMVKKKLESANNYKDTIIVKVELALGTTIWVSKMHIKFWDSKLQIFVIKAVLPFLLLNFRYAALNTEHLGKLIDLSTSAEINLTIPLKDNIQKDYKLSKEEFMSMYKLPKPQWAHLDQNVDALVSIGSIISPKCFFVRNLKYYDCVNDLNLKIDNYIEQKKVEELKHIVEGTFCLAKHPPTDQYSRVQVCKILDETNETLVEVFFVDIGCSFKITSNSFLTIHPNLIIALPFQVIECSLNGVKDPLPSYNELDELTEVMFNLTQDQLLYSKVINTTSQNFTGGHHYEVILFNTNININLEMHAKYNQYFNCNEISNQINNTYINDNRMSDDNKYVDSKELIDQKLPFDINLFDDDMDSEDLIVDQELLDQVGLAIFGQDYGRLKEIATLNHDITKKTNTEKISITPVTTNDLLEDCTNQSIEKTVSVDSEEPKTVVSQKKNKSKLCVNPRSPCLTCNNNVESIVPLCTWYQNKNYIFLRFDILEINDFRINCTHENIIFEAQFKETSYKFCAKLFSFIIDENVTHKSSYEGFQIKAEKLFKTDYKWPRLFTCNKWHKYIRYDPEHIKLKNSSIWLKEMNKFILKALRRPLPVNDTEISDCSDCDISDDLNIAEDKL